MIMEAAGLTDPQMSTASHFERHSRPIPRRVLLGPVTPTLSPDLGQIRRYGVTARW